jgi:GNAT superfamily N-acetyltransferase
MLAEDNTAMRLIKDVFITEHLGKPAYSLKVHSEVASKEISECIENEIGNGAAFVQSKIDTHQVKLLWELEKAGFCLADTNLQLALKAAHSKGISESPISRIARDGDIDAVRDIAGKAFRYSRFHMDPFIPGKTANVIKEEWACNFFKGNRGDAMVVAEKNKEIAGFLLLLKNKRQLIIDLIAVDSKHRGKGYAKEMIAFSLHILPSFPVMITGTQAANLISLKMYQNMGFKVVSSSYVLHRHS